MIELRLQVDPLPLDEPTVVRLVERPPENDFDATLIQMDTGRREYDFRGFSMTVHAPDSMDLRDDVLLLIPGKRTAHRLIRADSKHNTFLVTEQCDQLCVMCSQPPKKHHYDLFTQFAQAAFLAPHNAYIGVSGGEPTIHKDRLFGFLRTAAASRPDLKFHVLTNGQHLARDDLCALRELGHGRVLWGVPVYSAVPAVHDEIVGKAGAYAQLMRGLDVLFSAGADVELRTVVMSQNFEGLPALADQISVRLPFVAVWALMQMERIGHGRMNWKSSFKDTSVDFGALARALDIAQARGVNAVLYNFPLCSVPGSYRNIAPSTISDWKRAYVDFCDSCAERSACGGFFEWYKHDEGFKRLAAL